MKMMKDQASVIVMMIVQMGYTGAFLFSKAAISSGMKYAVLVVYRNGIGAVILAPISYFADRNRSPLTWRMLGLTYVVSVLLGLSMNLNYAAMKYVSPTYFNAMFNTVSLLVFVLALSFRIERVAIRKREGQTKVMGLILNLSGAAIYSLYKGPSLYPQIDDHHNSIARVYNKQDNIKGCLMTLGSEITFALWLILQAMVLKEYKAPLRQMALQSFFISVTTVVYALIVERNSAFWKVQWGLDLLSILYNGVVLTSIVYPLQLWLIKKRGPVFAASFNPLSLILTAVISSIFFHDILHLGSVIGSIILIGGLYCYLWGETAEVRKEMTDLPPAESTVINTQHEEITIES